MVVHRPNRSILAHQRSSKPACSIIEIVWIVAGITIYRRISKGTLFAVRNAAAIGGDIVTESADQPVVVKAL